MTAEIVVTDANGIEMYRVQLEGEINIQHTNQLAQAVEFAAKHDGDEFIVVARRT